MTYTITDAFKLNNKVYIALDKGRTASDLLCNTIVTDTENIKVNWMHPNELIQVEYDGNENKLIGKKCSLIKR